MRHRSHFQRRTTGRSSRRGDAPSFWESYSDMMAGLILMFILILVAVTAVERHRLSKEQTKAQSLQSLLKKDRNKAKELQKRRQDVLTKVEEWSAIHNKLVSELVKAVSGKTQEAGMVDPRTGALRIGEDILFRKDSATLLPQARTMLQEVVPGYLKVLLGDHYRDLISEIVVEGHASSEYRGKASMAYTHNLELSKNRAYAVLGVLLELEGVSQTMLRKKIVAGAYSNSRPIRKDPSDPESPEDPALSRRTEITFRLNANALVETVKGIVKRDIDESSL